MIKYDYTDMNGERIDIIDMPDEALKSVLWDVQFGSLEMDIPSIFGIIIELLRRGIQPD